MKFLTPTVALLCYAAGAFAGGTAFLSDYVTLYKTCLASGPNAVCRSLM